MNLEQIKKYSSLFLCLLIFASCSQMRSGRYVKIGNPYDLKSISEVYGVTLDRLRQENFGKSLGEGNWIFVPTSGGIISSLRVPSGRYIASVGALIWPFDQSTIVISSDFGYRGFSHHDGIDLPAPRGTKILAVASGVVVQNKKVNRGYGRYVIVDHGSFKTVYAHTSKNLVQIGDHVEQGQAIALVGRTGHATGNHLHFEVIRNDEHEDPLTYLPNDRDIVYR